MRSEFKLQFARPRSAAVFRVSKVYQSNLRTFGDFSLFTKHPENPTFYAALRGRDKLAFVFPPRYRGRAN